MSSGTAAHWQMHAGGPWARPASHRLLATLRLRGDRWKRVYETFFFFQPNSKVSLWDSKAGRGGLTLCSASTPGPWGSAGEPAACSRAWLPAAPLQRQAPFKGAVQPVWVATVLWPSRAPHSLGWQGRCFNRRGAGTHLVLHTHQAPAGLRWGHHVQGEGAFLRIRQGMCKMCSPPAKICLKYGLSMLLHTNSECENPARPSVS